MVHDIIEFFRQNELASGGTVVVLFGSLGYILRQLPAKILLIAKRKLVISAEMLDNDESFHWISCWLARHAYSRRSHKISVFSGPACNEEIAEQTRGRAIQYTPSPGWHLLRAFGTWFVVVRSRSEPVPGKNSLLRYESFVFHTMAWNRPRLRQLIQEARDLVHPPEADQISIYSGTWSWRFLSRAPCRSIETVVLRGDLGARVLADVERFQTNREWYVSRSIPYRRGYLLHGPPGNGKTSLILAVASHLKADIGLLSLSHPEMNDTKLLELLAECGNRQRIAVIEDIDEVFDSNRQNRRPNQQLTYSGLIGAIDGIASPQGQLLFMTTNHREHLDDSLIRPGRADVTIEIGDATAEQVRRLANLILADDASRHTDLIDRLANGPPLSMAAAQQQLVAHLGEGIHRIGEH